MLAVKFSLKVTHLLKMAELARSLSTWYDAC